MRSVRRAVPRRLGHTEIRGSFFRIREWSRTGAVLEFEPMTHRTYAILVALTHCRPQKADRADVVRT